jgi:fluoride ion exporter CrcB/FEX
MNFGLTGQDIPIQTQILFLIVFIWSTFWKGVALWKSSKNNQKYFFIAILLINTVGIFEIVYLLFLQKVDGKFQKFDRSNLNFGFLKSKFRNKFLPGKSTK